MKGIAFWFIFLGSLSALVGMAWGMQMSGTGDHTLASAHAHNNLIGFVAMSIYGLFYAHAPKVADGRLAKVHFGLALIAAVLVGPGVAMAVQGQGETLAVLGSIATILGALCFAINIWRSKTT